MKNRTPSNWMIGSAFAAGAFTGIAMLLVNPRWALAASMLVFALVILIFVLGFAKVRVTK